MIFYQPTALSTSVGRVCSFYKPPCSNKIRKCNAPRHRKKTHTLDICLTLESPHVAPYNAEDVQPLAPCLFTAASTSSPAWSVFDLPQFRICIATNTTTATMEGLKGIFRTKPIEVIHAEERKEELARELGLWDLIAIGIGGTVGSGIFSTAGSIISGQAGPAAFLSWAIAGFVSILSGFAYMEMSSLVPSSGSTYAYSYHILGELPAFVAAWLLTLEYGMSGAGVARSWSQKIQEWCEQGGGDYAFLNADHTNLMAFVVMFVSMVVLLGGLKFGKLFINVVTTTKVAVVLFIIVAGFAATKGDNLTP
ncbi:hypothetical protein As57867_019497, partial [Aphanomyces stellatus]